MHIHVYPAHYGPALSLVFGILCAHTGWSIIKHARWCCTCHSKSPAVCPSEPVRMPGRAPRHASTSAAFGASAAPSPAHTRAASAPSAATSARTPASATAAAARYAGAPLPAAAACSRNPASCSLQQRGHHALVARPQASERL